MGGRGERGQTAAEYAGILLVVAAVVAVLATGQLGKQLTCGVTVAIAEIVDGEASCGDRPADRRRAAPKTRRPADPRGMAERGAMPGALAASARTAKDIPGGIEDDDGKERPAKRLWPGWKPNGCSRSPDSGPFFDFAGSCNGHDRCYAQQRGRLFCDRGFKKAMKRSCDKRSWVPRQACKLTANDYYNAVRGFGASAYKNARKDAPAGY